MIALLAAWVFYFTMHSLLASAALKNAFRRQFPQVPFRYYRIFYNILFTGAVIILLVLHFRLPSQTLFTENIYTKILASFLVLCGLTVMVIACTYYDAKSFLGFTEEHSAPLQINGLNKYVRHPLYSGTSLMVLGVFVFMPSTKNLYFLILYFIYLVIGMWLEEKKLLKIYKNEYREYQQNVKRLIPGIW